MSAIGKSGARSWGPMGCPVPGCMTGGAGVSKSAWMLYHLVGRSFSLRRTFVSASLCAMWVSLKEPCPGSARRQRAHNTQGRRTLSMPTRAGSGPGAKSGSSRRRGSPGGPGPDSGARAPGLREADPLVERDADVGCVLEPEPAEAPRLIADEDPPEHLGRLPDPRLARRLRGPEGVDFSQPTPVRDQVVSSPAVREHVDQLARAEARFPAVRRLAVGVERRDHDDDARPGDVHVGPEGGKVLARRDPERDP